MVRGVGAGRVGEIHGVVDLLDREALLGLLEATQVQVEGTRALLNTTENDIDALMARLEKAEDHLARVRAERYWDQVMAEVHAILPAEGAMKPRDVLPRLSEATIRGRCSTRRSWTLGP